MNFNDSKVGVTMDNFFLDLEYDGTNVSPSGLMFETTGSGSVTIKNSVIRGTVKNWAATTPVFGFVAATCKGTITIINSSFAGMLLASVKNDDSKIGFICGESTATVTLGEKVSIYTNATLTRLCGLGTCSGSFNNTVNLNTRPVIYFDDGGQHTNYPVYFAVPNFGTTRILLDADVNNTLILIKRSVSSGGDICGLFHRDKPTYMNIKIVGDFSPSAWACMITPKFMSSIVTFTNFSYHGLVD